MIGELIMQKREHIRLCDNTNMRRKYCIRYLENKIE